MRAESMMTNTHPWLAVALFMAVASVSGVPAVEAVDSCCGACDGAVCPDKPIDPRGSMSRLLDQAPSLFLGMVVRAETVACCDRVADVTFRITKAYKAMVLDRVTIRTGAGCARPFPFAIGHEYLVAAAWLGQPPRFVAYCGFNPIEAKSAGAQIQELDAIQRTVARPEAAR